MMGNIEGEIKTISVSTGKSAKGDWVRYVFEMTDGKKYSTFNEQIGKGFKAGDYVVMTGQQAGKYWNMDSMEIQDKPKETQETKQPTQSNENTDLLRKILVELKEINGHLNNKA